MRKYKSYMYIHLCMGYHMYIHLCMGYHMHKHRRTLKHNMCIGYPMPKSISDIHVYLYVHVISNVMVSMTPYSGLYRELSKML